MAEQADVVIVGGGPAGLVAATYLRRFLRSCVVLDAGASRARYIPESHNCPGFPRGVSGEELLRRMREQAREFQAQIVDARVDGLEAAGDGFVVHAGAQRWRARKVILATGLADRLPDAAWAEDAIACGALRLCAVCDAYEARDGRVAVLGPAEVLPAHARFLRGYTSRLALLPSDHAIHPAAVEEMRGIGVDVLAAAGRLEFDGERCSWRAPDGAVADFDTVYPYLGYEGRNALLGAWELRTGEQGEVEVDRHQQTGVPGLYAVGDLVSGLNQIAVAVGQAAIAATHAHNSLPFVPRAAGGSRARSG